MLEVKQVSKLYENQRGVKEIDFSMQRGEIVGFLGPNGAGKTTTMRMITGYINPTRGSIHVDGLSMADHPKKARRKIGYLPETPPLYPEMSVLSYLKFIAKIKDVPARDQKKRIEEVVDKLGLAGQERQIIRHLSKGYKQRLGLAQAIIHKPDLLILDEPTSGLDPKQIIEIRQLIRELGENHTVLLSTHILPEVNAICNRVLIINQGRIVLDENPEHLGQTMADSFEVSLDVKGPADVVIPLVKSVDGVGTVEERRGEEASSGEVVHLHVKSADQTDIREQLFYTLAEAKYPIMEMRRERISLEDVFLRLTTDEQGLQAAEKELELEHKELQALVKQEKHRGKKRAEQAASAQEQENGDNKGGEG
ncbi:ATP-binding cassette domain-containing protein [Paenibacillus larvae]